MQRSKLLACATAALLVASTQANAALDFSFTGTFTKDNDVQQFTFTVGAASPGDVILRSWSYAGGLNAAGQTIARGGFDPILAVFDSSGVFIDDNDDGGDPLVAADAISGEHWDTYLNLGPLAAGTYTATIMQYDNFSVGPNLANGFVYDGVGGENFTLVLAGQPTGYFWDVSTAGEAGQHRDGHWAFDILNVESAAVPEPSTYLAGVLLALVLGVHGLRSLRNRRRVA